MSNQADLIPVMLTPEQAQFLLERSAGCFYSAAEAILIAPAAPGAVEALQKVQMLWARINGATQSALSEVPRNG